MQIQMTKEQLLARLNEQLPIAEAYDKETLTEHKRKEKEWHASYVAACKEAAKLPYEQAKERVRWRGELQLSGIDGPPECPVAMAVKFQQAIERLGWSNQKNFTLNAGNTAHQFLYQLVTWEPNPPKARVC